MFMPSFLNPMPAYNCFPKFTQSRKPNLDHLMLVKLKTKLIFVIRVLIF